MLIASTLVDRAADLIDLIGLLGVALLIAAESIFPPIPSELVLLLTGFNVSQGTFGPLGALVAATIGSVVGALVLYGVGATVGEDRMERLLATVGRPLGISRRDVHRANDWFERHGDRVVLVGRCIPLVRSLISLPAGADRMPLRRFVAYTTVGSAIWNALWIGLGWALGDQWERAEAVTGYLDRALLVCLAGGVVALLVRKRRLRRRAQLLGDDADTPSGERSR